MQPTTPNDNQPERPVTPGYIPEEAGTGRATFGQNQPPRLPRHRRLIIILVLAVLLLGGIFGWMWWVKAYKGTGSPSLTKTPATSEPVATDKDEPCATSLSNYENKSLGFGFCYPTAWGTAAATDAKFDPADTGTRWLVGFSSKSQVNLGVVSDDWTTTIPRDGTCVDPAVQSLPAFSPFSAMWVTEGSPAVSATRGVEVLANEYLLDERVDELLTNGACLTGYTVIDSVYLYTAASYSAEFSGAVTTVDQHVAAPETLISATDRSDFGAFVKSVYKVE